MRTLYIVATPIGNLSDFTERAREVLKTVPVLFAEDTRRTKILLDHIGAHPRLMSYHHHTTPAKLEKLLDVLAEEDAALVTDAGTPGVNDPGGQFIATALKRFGEELRVVPIPGPSALVAAASISGFPMDEFLYLGFPPHKKGRQTFFDRLSACECAVIFYESPHRILKAIHEVSDREPERQLVICRELTKQFETVTRGAAAEVEAVLANVAPRGEYVVVVGPRARR